MRPERRVAVTGLGIVSALGRMSGWNAQTGIDLLHRLLAFTQPAPKPVLQLLSELPVLEMNALGLPHENSGQLRPVDEWWGTDIGSIPIGQGVSVTAMQLLYAYNTIANGGVYQPPSLVSATYDEDGNRRPAERGRGHRVVSETTAEQVRSMLAEVVSNGTGTDATIDGYEVAGKTGTARKPLDGDYRDADGKYRYVASFVGFAPAVDPKLSIIVVMDEPTGSPYAGTVAAPAFAEIGRYALRHMEVAPAEAIGPVVDGERVRSTAATAPTTATTAPPATTTTTAPPATTTTAPEVDAAATTAPPPGG